MEIEGVRTASFWPWAFSTGWRDESERRVKGVLLKPGRSDLRLLLLSLRGRGFDPAVVFPGICRLFKLTECWWAAYGVSSAPDGAGWSESIRAWISVSSKSSSLVVTKQLLKTIGWIVVPCFSFFFDGGSTTEDRVFALELKALVVASVMDTLLFVVAREDRPAALIQVTALLSFDFLARVVLVQVLTVLIAIAGVAADTAFTSSAEVDLE